MGETTTSRARPDLDETGVRAVIDGIGRAWADNDADAFADAYTQDATMVLSGDRFLRGREVIRTVVRQQFATAHRGTTLLQDVVDLRFLGPGAAVATTEGGVLAPGEAQPAAERAIRATWVLVDDGGQWRITAYQNTRMADETLPGA
ncbi:MULTISPECIES: SgcJ/EcaC family oxidoreductase [unclassified Saccharothrix]|uniref:SgcJ/EcaC family oxidoreductase n=1 Tax=unclassified Saccharothrix TaxID=2593673 RepID=UPI00307DB562